MKIGVFHKSHKPHEKRLPLHRDDVFRVPEFLRSSIFFESGYGEACGLDEAFFSENFGGVLRREELFNKADIWLLIKPHEEDFINFREGKVLWGWLHCVQDPKITNALVENSMTGIAWENMCYEDGAHVFDINNEIAGFSSVSHALSCSGLLPAYDDSLLNP